MILDFYIFIYYIMQLNIDIPDIILLVILVLCISFVIGINITYIVKNKLDNIILEPMRTISYKENILDNIDVITNNVTTNAPILYLDRIGNTMGNDSDNNNYADVDQIGSIPLNTYFMEPVASNSV